MGTNQLLVFLVIWTVRSFVLAQLDLPGHCPDVQPMEDFDPQRFVGPWPVISGAGKRPYENVVTCVTWVFEADGNSLTRVNVELVSVSPRERINISGQLVPIGDPNSARFLYISPIREGLPIARNITILGTDYDHWAAMVACENYGNTHIQYDWILSRNRTLDADFLNLAKNLLQQNAHIPANEFFMRTQENCPTI